MLSILKISKMHAVFEEYLAEEICCITKSIKVMLLDGYVSKHKIPAASNIYQQLDYTYI